MRATKEVRTNRENFVRENKKTIAKILSDHGRTYGNSARDVVLAARNTLGYAPTSCGRDIWIWIVNTYKLLYAAKKLPGTGITRPRGQD